MPNVSVVIPTYLRPDLLERCLRALCVQTLAGPEYEVIVADDAASEATRAQVARLAAAAPCSIRYVPVRGTHGPAAARNRGWRSSAAEIIAFTDDDTVPDPDWLQAGLRRLTRAPSIVAAWGKLEMPLPDDPTDYELDAFGLCQAEFVTANCFCRRASLEAVGGFDERFRLAWREDSDLHFSLLQAFGPQAIGQAEDAVVLHPIRPAPWGVSLKQQKKNMFNALLYKKHPKLYRERIQRFPPWRYYAATVNFALALGAAALGLVGPGLIFLASFVLCILGFFLKRLSRTSKHPHHLLEILLTSFLIPFLAIYWRLRGAIRFRVLFF